DWMEFEQYWAKTESDRDNDRPGTTAAPKSADAEEDDQVHLGIGLGAFASELVHRFSRWRKRKAANPELVVQHIYREVAEELGIALYPNSHSLSRSGRLLAMGQVTEN